MNFYVDSGGNVFAVDPEKVYQGQAYANTIRMIGAFASNLAVTVGFTLPNGFIITPRLMTNVNDLSDKLEGFSVWEYTLPFTVTEYAGKVGVQFYVHGSRTRTVLVKTDAGTYEPVNEDVATVIATGKSSFNVEKGVPIYLPNKDEIPDYDNLLVQILAALSALQERYNLTNLENGEGEGSVQQKENTASGIYTFSTGKDNEATKQYAANLGGNNNKANASYSATLGGYGLRTTNQWETVAGLYNKSVDDALFSVGNGESAKERSNAFEVLKDGRAKVYGKPVDPEDVARKAELDGKVDKVPYAGNWVYTSRDGEVTRDPFSQNILSNAFVVRYSDGSIDVPMPNADYNSANKKYVDDQLSLLKGIRAIEPVESLPTENIIDTTLYLVTSGEEAGNEYIYVNGDWELIGTTKVDLSNYVTLDTAQDITGVKQFRAYEGDFDYGTFRQGGEWVSNVGQRSNAMVMALSAGGYDAEYSTNGIYSNGNTLIYPNKSGVLATTDDIPTDYVAKSDVESTRPYHYASVYVKDHAGIYGETFPIYGAGHGSAPAQGIIWDSVAISEYADMKANQAESNAYNYTMARCNSLESAMSGAGRYRHCVYVNSPSYSAISFDIITSDSTKFTNSTLATYIAEHYIDPVNGAGLIVTVYGYGPSMGSNISGYLKDCYCIDDNISIKIYNFAADSDFQDDYFQIATDYVTEV